MMMQQQRNWFHHLSQDYLKEKYRHISFIHTFLWLKEILYNDDKTIWTAIC